ncbi:MAG: hypothetical protein ACLP9L_26060, partial [Thermoguttaceae bacterium]
MELISELPRIMRRGSKALTISTATNGASFGLSQSNCWNYALATFSGVLTSSATNQFIMIMLGTNDAAEEISASAYQTALCVKTAVGRLVLKIDLDMKKALPSQDVFHDASDGRAKDGE